jgi:hypothetical protein
MSSRSRDSVSFLERRKQANASALDSPSNVAARVLSIFPRYLKLAQSYSTLYGPEMFEKARAIHELLGNQPDAFWTEDTTRNRSDATTYLSQKEQAALCGALASIIQRPSTPAQVLAEELDEIDRARKLRHASNGNGASAGNGASNGSEALNATTAGAAEVGDPVNRAINRQLVGLAFSGGGIRSATFNLGVLQALGDAGLVGHIDYLSTVSGGGYIGSWLESWIQQGSDAKVEQDLAPARASASQTEPDPVQFLRSYSNYLTPEKGMFSADTWTMLMIWARNTFLNLVVLVFTGACILLVPRLIGVLGQLASQSSLNDEVASVQSVPTSPLSLLALLLLLLATVLLGMNLRRSASKDGVQPEWYQRQHWVLLLIVAPTLAAAMVASFCLWDYLSELRFTTTSFDPTDIRLIVPAFFVFLLLLVTQFTGDFWHCFLKDKSHRLLAAFSVPAVFLFYPLFSALVFWGALVGIARVMWGWSDASGLWHALSFGTPLLLAAFALTMTIEVGLMGRSFPDDRREWIGRLGAWVSIFSLGVFALFATSLYGPAAVAWCIKWGGPWLASILPAGWLGTTLATLAAARTKPLKPGEQPEAPSLPIKLLTIVGPYVFIVGLLLLLTTTLHLILSRSACGANVQSPALIAYCQAGTPFAPAQVLWDAHWNLLNATSDAWLLGAFAICAFIALLFSRTVDINEFSLHHFYKNRLVRCYLGACRGDMRKPNPFTGFDENDERRLCTLRHDPQPPATDKSNGNGNGNGSPYYGPYPIINATLNLVKGDRLSWQERKGSSFIFTPKYSGWNKETNHVGSWVDTATYRTTNVYAYPDNGHEEGGIGLGTAMAISGAAVAPNMGYQSSGPLAFLMTVFNVRLGWWLGNPHLDAWRESGPGWGLNYLLTELFGLTTDRRKYIYLSDGGHFENLGIYELVRRRSTLIIACDAEQDGDMTFGGLGNAIRKCRTDFGVEIEIDVSRLRKGADGFSQEHCAVGTIRYPDRNGNGPVTGTLVYIKSSITGDEPTDVLEYRSRNSSFPHQTTADQFFDESQFESYRKLGYHIGAEALHPGKLVLLYAESIARLDEDRRKKFQAYRSRIEQFIERTGRVDLAPFKERIRPRLTQLLARPGQRINTARDTTVAKEKAIRDYHGALLDFMVEAIQGEEGKLKWEGEHAALLTLFDHWSRLEGFAGHFQDRKDLSAETRLTFQELLGL